MANHSARVECGVHAGISPVSLNSVAQVTTVDRQKTNCDAALDESLALQSRWPERLVVLPWRKSRDRRASLETTELEGESFSDVCGPISNPRG
jgi:hypothetical protein